MENFKQEITINRRECNSLQEFERYRKFNPNLSPKMFKFLLHNQGLWKILHGLEVTIPFENEHLPAMDVESKIGWFDFHLLMQVHDLKVLALEKFW